MASVKDVRFARVSSRTSGVVGLCSVSFDNGLIVYGVKVKVHNGVYSVHMPERKVGKDSELKSVVIVDSLQLRDEIHEAVTKQYFKLLDN